MAAKSTKSSVKYSQDVEEKLIGLVQERPPLFDKKNSSYKNRHTRDVKWEEIGKILGITGNACQILWNKLRNQFTGFLRKLKLKSGDEDQPRPYFRHENAMRFLQDIVNPDERTFSNLEDISAVVHELGTESEVDFGADADGPPGIIDPSNIGQASLPSNSTMFPRSSSTQNPKKRKLDAFDKEMLGLLKSEDDEFDSFGKMIAPKLRRISDIDRRAYLILQKKVNDAVLEAEMDLLL